MGFKIGRLLGAPKDPASGRRGSKLMRATWRGATLAESDQTIVIDGTHYFPPGSVSRGLLKASQTHTSCPTKGQASYYSISIGSQSHRDAAWYYPDPSPQAAHIRGYVAFWRGVQVRPAQRWSPGQGAPERRGA